MIREDAGLRAGSFWEIKWLLKRVQKGEKWDFSEALLCMSEFILFYVQAETQNN